MLVTAVDSVLVDVLSDRPPQCVFWALLHLEK